MVASQRVLEPDAVRELVERSARMTLRALADEYGVSTFTVSEILHGRRYCEVTGLEKIPVQPRRRGSMSAAQAENRVRVRRMAAWVLCVHCGHQIRARVGVLLDCRWAVSCEDCDRRRG